MAETPPPERTIQIVLAEGTRPLRILLERRLPEGGRVLITVKSGLEAQELPHGRGFDQRSLDFEIPSIGRVELHRRHSAETGAGADLLVVSAHGEPPESRLPAEPEAYDFLTKPLATKALLELAREVDEGRFPPAQDSATARVRRRLGGSPQRRPILVESPAFDRLLQLVDRVAAANATVLIQGETGSGKGMIARLLHELSPRAADRFVAINCSAFQDQLLESELFGHEKGAFTGAVAAKEGLFEVANGGTLFLDEVAEMSPAMQAKLLHVLDAGEIRRVGGTRTRHVEPRIIAASNKNLREEVRAGRFREDLLFRLNVVTLAVPPLRERRQEIPQLVEGFLERLRGQGLEAKTISPEAMALLADYAWPGNVRELANTIEGLLLLTPGDRILPRDLPPSLRPGPQRPLAEGSTLENPVASPELPPVPLSEVERQHVTRALRYTEGKKAPAARFLGIDVKTLNSKIRGYGIEVEPDEP